jgi:uncharacterized protein
MAAYYLDTSALVKRYAHEQGSGWIVNLTRPSAGHEIFTVLLTGPEMIAALFRKAKTGQVSQIEAIQAAALFKRDWQTEYQIISITPRLAEDAMAVAEKHGLRGFDSVHLAGAIILHLRLRAAGLPNLTFVSADKLQVHAAASEGIMVEDPNNHR